MRFASDMLVIYYNQFIDNNYVLFQNAIYATGFVIIIIVYFYNNICKYKKWYDKLIIIKNAFLNI